MSGYASYADAMNPKYGDPFPVPIVKATEDTLKDYGRIVRDFYKEKVEITPWPVKGSYISLHYYIYRLGQKIWFGNGLTSLSTIIRRTTASLGYTELQVD